MDEAKTLADKMSGRIRQPEDAGGKRTLSGNFLRSELPRGRIVSIDMPERPAGVVSLIAKDIPGRKTVKFGGVSVPILSDRNILWKGQPILAAAGPDIDELQDWISRIHVEIKAADDAETPAVTEKTIEKGSPAETFSKAFQVIEELIEIPQTPGSSRPESVVCIKDGNSYVLHTASSWPGIVGKAVAGALKTGREQIRVRPYSVRGGSNIRLWNPAIQACRAALLSSRAKRSVKISSTPAETRLHTPGLPGGEFHIRGAVDADGRVLALEADFSLHTGALLPFENEFFERVVLGLFSIYPCRHYTIRGRISRKPQTPSGFGPGAGFELGFLAGELFASRVAENSLSPPGSWRRESLPVPGQAYGSGILLHRDFPMNSLLSKVIAVSDFERKSASFEQTRLARRNLGSAPKYHRGIGLSCAWFGNGFITSPKELGSASLSLTLDKKGALTIDMPVPNPGGALQRAWSNLSQSILGVESASVNFSGDLAAGVQDPGPSILGRNVSIYSKLLELAANDLAKRRFREALPITVTRTRRRSGTKAWSSEMLEGAPFETTSWGVGIVEVSVSSITMEVVPTRIWLMIDGGNLLMPEFARSAVESSSEEALIWCTDQQPRKTSPLVDIQFHDAGSRRQSKDVATLPWLLIPAAFLQAVRQASGIGVSSIPVTPDLLRDGGLSL